MLVYTRSAWAIGPPALRHGVASIKCQKSKEETVQVGFRFVLLLFRLGSELFTFLQKYTHSVILGCVIIQLLCPCLVTRIHIHE